MSSSEPRNRVLAELSAQERAQLLDSSIPIPLTPGDLLHRFGEQTERLLFPLSGVISLTVPTPEGANVEVALVGREGVFGVNRILGGTLDLEAIAQVAGEAIATPVRNIPADLKPALARAIQSYTAGLLVELAQTAGCNRVHSVEERTARWLLHAVDRAESTDLRLTHDFLAMMLGVRRASVTVVVGAFESAGLIASQRRRISIIDRDGLIEYSCACYEVIRNATRLPGARSPIAGSADQEAVLG